MIYLDNNATTRPLPGVVEACRRALEEGWANPSSVHREGQTARREVELARRDVAALIGGEPRDLIFTSGGTESCDLAIRGLLAGAKAPVLATTRVEHAAVRELAEHLERTGAARVVWIPLLTDGSGQVDLLALASLLDAERPTLVSVQWANNETGVAQAIDLVSRLCRSAGVPLHCDAVQWVGKEPTDVRSAGVDLLSLSAHKFHGPKGVGALWVRRGVRLRPTLIGTQELGRRGGTENVPGIVGAGAAAREAAAWLKDGAARDRMQGLRDRFERGVLDRVAGAVVNGGGPRVWNTTNIGFPGAHSEALLLALSERGLCASAGAACSSGSLDPSPVLLAMGVPDAVAHASLRFSLSRQTTEAEVDEAADLVAWAVERVRGG
ncbi:MAG: cysteine desulfurase [Phycisphaerae bacterium]|nr:cysteine desulfurase [Phycisphaerae bacterium]